MRAIWRCSGRWRFPCAFEDGQNIFRAGDADLDLFVVESGAIEIMNPSDGNRHIVTHGSRSIRRGYRFADPPSGDRHRRRAGPRDLMRVPEPAIARDSEQGAASWRNHADGRDGAPAAAQLRRAARTQGRRSGQMPRYDARARIPFQEFRPFTWYDSTSRGNRTDGAGDRPKNRRSSNSATAVRLINPKPPRIGPGRRRLAALSRGHRWIWRSSAPARRE
jgi:CRP-like cAMP-binding protein